MNQQQRIIESEKYIRKIKRIEAVYIKQIYQLTIERAKSIIETLRSSGVQRARAQIDHIVIDADLIEIFQHLHTTVGIYSANRTLAQIAKSIRPVKLVPASENVEKALEMKRSAGFGFDEELYQAIVNFFRLHILNKAVLPYTQFQKDLFRQMLEDGIREGSGVEDIVDSILESVSLERYRIERIVRTETQFAMEYGRKEGQSKSRWQSESEWIAANDHRTRHSHRDIDGDKVDEGQRFRVPIYKRINKQDVIVGFDFMSGPGDITASAGNVINCRCTMATTAKRDKNGRLILKKDNNPGISVILPQDVFRPHAVITI